jgi:hypothetical protein
VIVTQFQALDKKAHDARLVAAAIFYECDGIVIFNAAGFLRFAPLQVLTPEEVLQAYFLLDISQRGWRLTRI